MSFVHDLHSFNRHSVDVLTVDDAARFVPRIMFVHLSYFIAFRLIERIMCFFHRCMACTEEEGKQQNII